MAESKVNRDAKAWNEARNRYQQLKATFDKMGPETPFHIQEDAEVEVMRAEMAFLSINAPHLDGVCERILVMWGEKLFDEEDPEMEMLLSIVGNLRQLARKQI